MSSRLFLDKSRMKMLKASGDALTMPNCWLVEVNKVFEEEEEWEEEDWEEEEWEEEEW
ncbi:MAG: hypothetical protein ACP5JW_00330 [Candidatus Bathyarchaeia archaeon]